MILSWDHSLARKTSSGCATRRSGTSWSSAAAPPGLGSAVDAAARGYRTLLLEAHDFAHGTSSRSTKLIHGGVRYLAQGNVPLVREALQERGILLRNAPQLVHRARLRGAGVPLARAALLRDRAQALRLARRPTQARLVALDLPVRGSERGFPTIRGQGLHGGIVYTDGQFDDARLAITLARTLADLGGTALNYTTVTDFTRRDGRIAGLIARDAETGEEFDDPGPRRDQCDRGVSSMPCGGSTTPAPRRS